MVYIKVFELAKKNNLTSKEIIAACKKIGIDAGSSRSVLDPGQVNKVLAFLKKAGKAADGPKKKSGQKVSSGDKKKTAAKAKGGSKAASKALKKAAVTAKKKVETKPKTAASKLKTKDKAKEDKKAAVKTKSGDKVAGKAKAKTRPKAKIAAKTAKKVSTPEKIKDKEKPSGSKDITVKTTGKAGTSKAVAGKTEKKFGWEEEKRINIQSVLKKELDKEEKSGRLKAKLFQKRRKDTLKEKQKDKAALKKKPGALKEKLEKRPEIKKVIEIPEGVTIKQLSERISKPSNEMVQLLFNMGETITVNQSLTRDLVEYLSHEYDFKYNIIGFEEKLDEVYKDSEEDLVPRAPIVTVMGHVDHGKTTLLDAIRKTEVAESEVGGITQNIGAYQVIYNDRKITFIDTPGHEAFASIRARGASVTDIAIILVAADDGIMPQTVEAIDHAKEAGVPMIIAINKIDLPNADPGKVKKSLTEHDLVPEEWGGETICVELSAKNKINLDELLEMILLVTDLNEIKGNPNAEGTGVIIESKLDKGRGPIGTLMVKRGNIKVGDSFIAGNISGRIRSIKDEHGRDLKEAVLSQPVEIAGFSSVPGEGDKLFIVKNEKVAKELLKKKIYERKMQQIVQSRREITLENLVEISKESEQKKLKLVLKAESEGSVDAVDKSLAAIDNEKIKIDIIHKAVGSITDSDVLLAAASRAIAIGFRVNPTPKAKELSKKEKVEIRTYEIIYKLIDDITLASEGLLEPEIKIIEKGKAEVREIFKMSKLGIIAGSYITEGAAERGDRIRVLRDGEVIHEGKIHSLHRFKEDVKKVSSGYECGVRIESYQDIAKGDILQFFEEKKG